MNKKGFTLPEILITIAIVGTLSLIATVSILKIKDKFDKSYYETITSSLKVAAKDYGTDHRSSITKEGIKIDITTFIKNGYISEIKDKNKEDCSGYVIIKKNRYTYDTDVCLICDNYESKGCEK